MLLFPSQNARGPWAAEHPAEFQASTFGQQPVVLTMSGSRSVEPKCVEIGGESDVPGLPFEEGHSAAQNYLGPSLTRDVYSLGVGCRGAL
jgi:hypothetical protein